MSMFADAKISSLGYPCFYFLIFHFEIDLQLESAVCRSPYERDSIDDQLEMAALHVGEAKVTLISFKS